MNLIKDKKINKNLMIAFIYLSCCMSGYFPLEGQFAHMGISFLSNKIVIFILAGIFPTLIYELITSMMFRMNLHRLGGGADDCRYALRFFFIPANIVIGLVKLLYIPFRIITSYGEIFINFLVYTIFFIIFICYSFKNYFPKPIWGRALMSLGSTFLTIYGLLALIELLMEVI